MPVVKKARTAMPAPSTVINAAEATGSQRVVSGPFTMHAAQETAPIDHQHAETNQHRGKAETEGNDKKEAQANTMQSEGAQQDYQRRRARDDSASNAQEQRAGRGKRVWRVRQAGAMQHSVCWRRTSAHEVGRRYGNDRGRDRSSGEGTCIRRAPRSSGRKRHPARDKAARAQCSAMHIG